MAPPPQPPKRRATVLVTDARDPPPPPRALRRPSFTPPPSSSSGSNLRHVSVDSILRGSSEIPSGQARGLRQPPRVRGPPRRVPPQGGQGHFLQSRSSKVSEKLVLIPETEEEETRRWDYQDEDEDGPLRDDEEGDDHFPEEAGPLPTRKSYAERLPKYRRAEKFSRVTAYCIADGFRLKNVSKFLKETHGAKTKLYDECLYAAYHLPLLGGGGGYRIKSSPALKSPGGKPVLDVEIERSEQRNYHEGYFDNDYEDRRESVDDGDVGSADLKSPHPDDLASQGAHFSGDGGETEGGFPGFQNFDAFGHGETDPQGHIDDRHEQHDRPDTALQSETRALDNQSVIDMKGIAEVFIFSYGVVVLWNFSERQEKDILADLTFSRDKELPLVVNQWSEKDFENEEFHFQYSQRARSPRIYNDMITLCSGDILIKLSISHAIAQSTKLCSFEERMSETMSGVEHIPKQLALTGALGMDRPEVIKMTGRLYRLRVNVNLSSNVLDIPEFFWVEPGLKPIYEAVREYLEIGARATTLNSRCRVFLDLAEILNENIAEGNMNRITWIIIWLIVLSILVTLLEVGIRFGLLSKHAGQGERMEL
ncbi:hypothetical protein FPQ18DRAFT_356276 [Pyronema domesticum]|uniref:Similar to Sporulation protein RMD8 acc. no. P43620 n=1 Tax=Pyronema omphalodes (strain CBS 100304) TaxID=1076935 RepID=U4LPX4_PYROM|nr:hypothetical protein FPQ18DRAFT_356276 [Pyronema domesticum]CCX31370.1 Similar to Sporulation protein RMD8; acc. no. P43620 [Pyronema omphalodes CBS 100304]